MEIYVAHSSGFDFRTELYEPIRNSELNNKHHIVLPHENSDEQFDSKTFLKKCDLVIAEVSFPSTGMGIELGWADYNGVRIVCVYKTGTKPSGALHVVSTEFVEYGSEADLIKKLQKIL